jgi:hypothetical protein
MNVASRIFFLRLLVFFILSIATLRVDARFPDTAYPIPRPMPVETPGLQPAVFMCPLWDASRPNSHWEKLKAYPDRKPLLGWYAEGEPQVIDAEIKFAVEHGIRIFNVCWYRMKANEGKRKLEELYGHWTKGLRNARYADMIRYSIMYVHETGSSMAGIKNMADFKRNLVPYWINEHFRQPNYHVIGNKPIFTIYRPENFVEDLGGVHQAREAISFLRAACEKAGFDGLIIFGEYHGPDNKDLTAIYKGIGLDYAVSYHWPSFTKAMLNHVPSADSIVLLQEAAWNTLSKVTGLPSIPTASVGWDSSPWGNAYYKGSWRLPQGSYIDLLTRIKKFALNQNLPEPLMKGLIMLDNWNEYAEGHHIFPTVSENFTYLDAIRKAFSMRDSPHADSIPNISPPPVRL